MFFYMFFTVYILSHLYILHRIIYGFGVKSVFLKLLITVFIISAASWAIYAHVLARSAHKESILMTGLIQAAYIWLGVLSISFFLFFARDLILIFIRNAGFTYYSTLTVCVFALGCSAYCIWNVGRGPVIKNISVKVPNMSVDKFTIVQLADMHIDSFTPQKEIEEIVQTANGLDGDIIVLAGDIIERSLPGDKTLQTNLTEQTNLVETYGLNKLKSKYGIFAVSGNHEYYAGISDFYLLCQSIGAAILDNSSMLVNDCIYVAGVPDKAAKSFNYQSVNISQALQNVDFQKPVIFLSHQPHIFEEVSKYPVTLQLSGHMHAGQIPPFDLIEKIFFKYFYGLYQKSGSYLYVTSGTRWWGPPMRLFSRSEIVKITLHK